MSQSRRRRSRCCAPPRSTDLFVCGTWPAFWHTSAIRLSVCSRIEPMSEASSPPTSRAGVVSSSQPALITQSRCVHPPCHADVSDLCQDGFCLPSQSDMPFFACMQPSLAMNASQPSLAMSASQPSLAMSASQIVAGPTEHYRLTCIIGLVASLRSQHHDVS